MKEAHRNEEFISDEHKRSKMNEMTKLEDFMLQPVIGMKVASEDDAYNFYNQYALRMGFSVRKGTKRCDRNGDVRQREYMCSKAGFREFGEPLKMKRVIRLETRTGCNARIRFALGNGVWEITSFNSEHNHELASDEEKSNLRSGRRINSACGSVIKSMVSAGIKPIKSYSYLAKELGGQNNIGFTKRDFHNYLRAEQEKMIEAGDGQSIMNHFRYRQAMDPMFFYSVQVDQYNRMANFFWRDGRSQLDFDLFGDVVVFDTTYRTNRYNLICAPFVGINHHWKNVLFGCAFLLNETTESFTWLFETFKDAMGGRQPKTIFTDQDQAMANAIETVFPDSRHRLCLWHISKNARQNLAGLYANGDFYGKFGKCLNGCIDVNEFECCWRDMIQSHNLEKNIWLTRLYELKEKWCPAFSVDIFSARMRSTQRSESMNSVFHQIMRTSMSLIEVIRFYEQKEEEMRQDEYNEDFRCKNGAPAKIANYGGVLEHAARVYTLVIFRMFEEEFLNGIGMNCVPVSGDGVNFTYTVAKHGSKREFVVQYNQASHSIQCICKLFETMGLLCSHALRVLIVNNVNMIPEHYILQRWTKGARNRLINKSELFLQGDDKSSLALRLSELNHLGRMVFDKGCLTANCTRIVREKLLEAMELVDKEVVSVDGVSPHIESNRRDIVGGSSHLPVLDPPRIRKKGLTNARIKSQLEKKRKRNPKVPRETPSSYTASVGGDIPSFISSQSQSLYHGTTIAQPDFSFTRLLQENIYENQVYWVGGNEQNHVQRLS